MARVKRVAVACLMALLLTPERAAAYSVLAHEANVDALWDGAIRPLLVRRFPRATRADLQRARAYAYGGSVIQDLGYYPFGNHFFSNLLHYVRSGDFVETLIRDARDLNEFAFALGALAPAHHVITEFSFDIVQVAAGAYLPDTYHAFIGFQVAKPVLERAFREVYGLEMKDVFRDEDLAISTYRRAVSDLIPHLTRTAWKSKKEEIARLTPGVKESAFIYTYTRQQYEKEFGIGYEKPGWFARLIATFYKILPKVGPLKPLDFKTPTPEAEELFAASFQDTRRRYGAALDALGRGQLNLPNTVFDTGRPSVHGSYPLADETYAKLIDRLSDDDFETVPAALRRNIVAYYAAAPANTLTREEAKRMEKVRKRLAVLRAAAE